jgi:hypothetical protein
VSASDTNPAAQREKRRDSDLVYTRTLFSFGTFMLVVISFSARSSCVELSIDPHCRNGPIQMILLFQVIHT